MDKKRFSIQAAAALIQNANLKGFFSGRIYTGKGKLFCVPGLNCYSCPGAVGSCPVGALQSYLGGLRFRFPYYIVGLLLFFGALLGRAVCGFLCPFGLFQELVYRIPFPVKRNQFPGDRKLRYLKYLVLMILVILLPLCFSLVPFFCKYLCPSGTISGMLLAAHDSMLRSQLGGIFLWKFFVLFAIVFSALIIWRPFCKYLCPLGAIYGLMNRFSLFRLQADTEKCIHCGACAAACKMCADPSKQPDSPECIRCGCCITSCPADALKYSMRK